MIIDTFEELLMLFATTFVLFFIFKTISKDFLAAAYECLTDNSCKNSPKTKKDKPKFPRRKRYDNTLD